MRENGRAPIIHVVARQLHLINPQVQQQVKEAFIARQNKKTALNKLNEYKDRQMKLDETNLFIDFCLEKIYRESNKEKNDNSARN